MEKTLPTIKVVWDAERQVALPEFDTSEFKTWDMVVGALKMALTHAEFKLNVAMAQGMQHAMAQAQQAVALRNKLRLG